MRSKLGLGVLGVAVAFLLATNPVVVNAAGQITSAQIKNETIKSKDIKNNQVKSADIKDGTVTAGDLAADAIPTPAVEVKAVKRFQTTVNQAIPISGTLSFFGATNVVTVDGDDTLVVTATAAIDGAVAGDDIDFAICVSSGGTPSVLGGGAALYDDIDLVVDDNVLTAQAASVLSADSYTVGWCAASPVVTQNFQSVVGIATVYNGSGPLAKSTGKVVANSDKS
jgi:hypothetical protein